MDKAAIRIAENWHKDLFIFKGISLGQFVEWYLKYYFAGVIRNLITIINIIDTENPTEIITFEDYDNYIQEFNLILSHICISKGISLNLVPIEETSLDIFKLKPSWKNLILKYFITLLNLKQTKLVLKNLSHLILLLRTLKRYRKNKTTKKILMIGSHSYESLIKEMSKKYNIILLNYFQSIPKIKENIINLISVEKTGFYKFFEDYKNKKIKKQVDFFIKKSLFN